MEDSATCGAQPAPPASRKGLNDLPIDVVAQALGLDIFNYSMADALRTIEVLQATAAPASDEVLGELGQAIEAEFQAEKVCENGGNNMAVWRRANEDARALALRAAPALLARVRQAEADNWVSVKERLPENSGSYLCHRDFIGEGGQRTKYTNMGYYNPNDGGFSHNSEVTHWRPLPADPTVKGGQPNV